MPAAATTRGFTVDECYRMVEVGILEPGERVELIDGEVVQMAAIGSRQAACVNRLSRLLSRGLGHRVLVVIQNPVRLTDLSEFDRDVKGALYAAADIPEYWLVDLPEDRIRVFREPGDDGYGTATTALRGDVLQPPALLNLDAPVDAILP